MYWTRPYFLLSEKPNMLLKPELLHIPECCQAQQSPMDKLIVIIQSLLSDSLYKVLQNINYKLTSASLPASSAESSSEVLAASESKSKFTFSVKNSGKADFVDNAHLPLSLPKGTVST